MITTHNNNNNKKIHEFRNYTTSSTTQHDERVREHYKNMRLNQSLEFVKYMHNKWFIKRQCIPLTLTQAFELLDKYVDASDPDSTLPNVIHALQTAESLRKAGHPEWLQLTGLLHDFGKIMSCLIQSNKDGQGCGADDPQWSLGGDTWIMGCALPESLVYPEFNILNHDMQNDQYNTKYGMYDKNVGLEHLIFAFGHDEYMYHVLRNGSTLPEEALAIVRYHSCYALHRDHSYDHLLLPKDEHVLSFVRMFNEFDLYTKADEIPSMDVLSYYEGLFEKFVPGGRLFY